MKNGRSTPIRAGGRDARDARKPWGLHLGMKGKEEGRHQQHTRQTSSTATETMSEKSNPCREKSDIHSEIYNVMSCTNIWICRIFLLSLQVDKGVIMRNLDVPRGTLGAHWHDGTGHFPTWREGNEKQNINKDPRPMG